MCLLSEHSCLLSGFQNLLPVFQNLLSGYYILLISPRCLTHYTIEHRGQLNMHYHQTTYLPIINIRHDYRLQQNRRTFTNYKKADWTQFTEDTRVRFRSDHHTSSHLATRGNNKIMRTPPPTLEWCKSSIALKRYFPCITRRTLAHLRTSKSPFLKSYLHKVDAKTHPSPLSPLCIIHTHDTHHLFNCTHIRTTLSPLDLWEDPVEVMELLARWRDKLAGRNHKRDHQPPP